MEAETLNRAVNLPNLPLGLGISEEHLMLRDQAGRLLGERCTPDRIRRLYEEDAPFDEALWQELCALGWLQCNVPEELGGTGTGALPLSLLMEEMGRTLCPSPFLVAVLSLAALSECHPADKVRDTAEAILNGNLVPTVAFSEPHGVVSPLETQTTAVPIEGYFRLTGIKTHVLFGQFAGLLIVSAMKPDGRTGVFRIELPSPGVAIRAEDTVDATRPTARVTLTEAIATELICDGAVTLRHVERLGLVLLAAEMVGAAETLLCMTTEYATDRKQFGRSIGSFQAVKHPLVDSLIGVEHARSLYVGAASLLDHDPGSAETTCRMAKAKASDVFAVMAKKGVQLHGGIGFTWDCDVHPYFRRMLWARATLGDGPYQRARMGSALLNS